MAEIDEVSNEELFNSALTDEAPVAVEQTAADEGDQRARDEHGRFVAKTEEPEPKPETEQAKPVEAKDEAHVPSWRLKEIREERDQLRQQLAQFMARNQPQPEKPAKPDIFENPDGFVKQGVQEAVDPIKAEVNSIKEQFSLMYAIDKHGEEKVNEAYSALHKAAISGDPEAQAVVNRVKSSMTPFQEMVKWHEKQSIISEIDGDPQAWFQKQLEAKLQDEKFKGELLSKLKPEAEKPRPVFNVPPSLNRAASAAAALDEAGDLSNESIFKFAVS